MSEPTKKNFSSLAPSGAEKIDPEVSKFEKCYFLGFLKKGPQGPPKRSKINSNGIFGYRGPKWPTKKIFVNFRDGGAKSVYMLTERRHRHQFRNHIGNRHLFQVLLLSGIRAR